MEVINNNNNNTKTFIKSLSLNQINLNHPPPIQDINNNNNNVIASKIEETEEHDGDVNANNNNFNKKKLDLSNSNIYYLDEILNNQVRDTFENDFKSISILNLDHNLLGVIPDAIKVLKSLESLSIRYNYIIDIPSWVPTHFTLLRKLDLSHNSISVVPNTFNQFSILESLNLSFNNLSFIHPNSFPANLITLDLSHNQFHEIELPPWFESLITLDISSNKLQFIGNLPYHLAKVSIDDNHLESIDHKVILRNKDHLSLRFNQSFSDIVLERIYQCWYTTDPVLDLSGMGMLSVPPVLGMLTHLTHLDLSGNCISVLPPELENLTELVRLDLSYNIMATLPLYIINYKKLETLELQGTIDTLVSPPKRVVESGIAEIKRYFQDLFLGDPSYRVKLMIVGQENVGKTSLVKCLKMKKKFAKGIDHLGPNVSTDGIDIEEIKFSLDIETSANQMNNHQQQHITISTQTTSIINTSAANHLLHQHHRNSSLHSTGTGTGTNSSATQINSTSGAVAVASHLTNNNNVNSNNNTNSGSNSTNSNKSNSMAETGSGNGNNSFLNPHSSSGTGSGNNHSHSSSASIHPTNNNNHMPPHTSSSSSNTVLLKDSSGNNSSSNSNSQTLTSQKITVSVWDCAGQELYYTTHQMFLTDSALYVVVWDLCKPEVNSRVEFWLHSIRSKAENAPILLIGTHLDDFNEHHTEQELDEILNNIYLKYFRKFRLKGICVVSCLSGAGFDNFQDLLKKTITELPLIKQPLPDLYLKLEKLIIKKRSTLSPPILTWSNYCSMVLSNLDFHDDIHLKVATKALVPLGILSFFDEPGLDNYIFLDPQWLTGVFSSIITTKHKFIKDGILKKSDLYQIWKPPNFLEDEGLHTLLINLLERFELMFNLEHANQQQQLLQQQQQQQQPQLNPSQSPSQSFSLNGSNNNWTKSNSNNTKSVSPMTTLRNKDKIAEALNGLNNGGLGNTSSNRSSVFIKKKTSAPTSPSTTRARSNSDYESGSASGILSPTLNSTIFSTIPEPIPENGSPTLGSHKLISSGENSIMNQKFIIPSQLTERRPQFDLLWPPHDQSRIEYNRWFQLSFTPSGLFSRLLIRLLISKEFEMKPVLYWRYGVVVESHAGKSALSTASALIEIHPNPFGGITTIKISVRADRRTGKGLAAKFLRLIVEITDTLCTSWYHLEAIQVVPCPHCVFKGKFNSTLFYLTDCEATASLGVWFLQCGDRKISLESFVPDVALSDFWGSGSKKFNYNQIQLFKHKKILVVKRGALFGDIQFDVKSPPPTSPSGAEPINQMLSPRIPGVSDLPIISKLLVVPQETLDSQIMPIEALFDNMSQTIIVTGNYKMGMPFYEVEYESPTMIGRGASGKIYKALLNGSQVAVKQLEVVGEDAPRIFSEFRKEIHVMSDLKHPNVVNLLGFTIQPFTMVMEYIECGDLHKFLHNPIGDVLNNNWPLILKLALDIAKGMDFLHSVTPPLLHRDLKSPNILLTMKDGNYHAKVGDFGLSSRMFIQALRHKLRNFPVGNITWVAPEILREEEYTVKSDVYAFGLILHELLTRKHPYKEFNYSMVSLLEEAIKNGLRPTIPNNYIQSSVVGHEYCSLIRDCWDGDVDRRPTFTKIVKRLRQIISRDSNNILVSDSPSGSLSLSSSFHNGKLDESSSPVFHSGNHEANASEEHFLLGGQLQMSLRSQSDSSINSLVWENRRVWGGCQEGALSIWNAENGKRIMYEERIHDGPIHCLALVDQEDVWSAGGVGKKASIRTWNCWRLNLDDQPRFKSDLINKKGRGHNTFGRKSWAQRWFVLDRKTKTFNYYSTKQADKAPNCTLLLEGATIEQIPGSPLKITLTAIKPEPRTMELEFKNESEKNQWVTALNRIINQNIPLSEILLANYIKSDRDYISNLLVSPNGQYIWVSFKHSGKILVYSKKLKLVEEINIDDFESPDASLWKGTDKMICHHNFIWLTGDNLLAQIDINSFQVVNVHCQYSQPILSIASVDQSVWVSCQDSSISIWDGVSGTIVRRIETSSQITKLLQFGGFVWACCFGNIQIFCPVTQTLKKQIDCKQHPNSIKELIKVFQQTVWSCCGSNNVCIWS
ncbi:hypothetical protein CYY_009538 [Polysphondylium violaceum]|uniref:non-specific serine/threonine protein kinase n=1 Tax=Polysphondylium violaceum TaxID=133409 RepID=A0A8J4PMN8_9MYCE|nr:hypothetical protein CYY_009538 [Polysphondylium violaceum]